MRMNKEQLEIAKKIAEIEGITLFEKGEHLLTPDRNGYMSHNRITCDWYNPFDWSVCGKLLEKYWITVNISGSYYCTQSAFKGIGTCEDDSLGYSNHLPTAILQCVIAINEGSSK
jgi:hypothetical protein